jgi:hypothetical protein
MRPGARIWIFLIICFLILICASVARADLTFPALFEIVEETPGKFRLSLTVPLIRGRYLKAKPIVPDNFLPQEAPEAREGSGTLTRSWHIEAEASSLYNKAFGLKGLLGTSQEVRFLLATLDGRRHETILRSTRSIFFVPPPPVTGRLATTALRDGLRYSLGHTGTWALLACVIFSGIPVRRRRYITLAVSIGFLVCWSLLMAVPGAGLSDSEVGLMTVFQTVGFAAGTAGAIAVLMLFHSLLSISFRFRVFTLAFIVSAAWVFYEGTGLALRHGPVFIAWINRLIVSLVNLWFSPFIADWAMAKLRIPFLSLAAIGFMVWGFLKIKRANIRLTVTGCLFLSSLALLPYGVSRASVPFMSPETPLPQQARRIIEPMLSRIYHALNLEDESRTYDRLAEQVSGDLVTDLYLDSRRRLVAGTREGAVVEVIQVTLQDVGALRDTEGEIPEYSCRWTVTARVTHWQHIHQRRNLYEGYLRLAVENDQWKLAGLNLRSEEREVMPGSFQSR